MSMIYHITTQQHWQQAQQDGIYTADSLPTEGFMHCSNQQQVKRVADRYYYGKTDLLLLCIDEQRVQAAVKWEAPAHPDPNNPIPVEKRELFPHIYGSLNLDAVVAVRDLLAGADGLFQFPL
jgi:uncharacterized protein (DUF952 family)